MKAYIPLYLLRPNVRGKLKIGAMRGLCYLAQMSTAEICQLDRAC